jgi:hypothetical protein
LQKRWDIRNFYVTEEFIPVWEQFKEICVREGESASQKIREFVERYVCVHAGGNPQQLIERYFGMIPNGECFFCRGQLPNLKKVEYISGLIAPTCPDCLEKNQAKGKFSTLKRVIGATT